MASAFKSATKPRKLPPQLCAAAAPCRCHQPNAPAHSAAAPLFGAAQRAAHPQKPPPPPAATIPPEEREEIAQFMKTVFTRAKWDIDGWRRLLAGRWCGPEGRYAVAVRDEGRLIGVLGLVYADRMTSGGLRTTADMTSWYILKEYRGQGIGQQMLAFATSDP